MSRGEGNIIIRAVLALALTASSGAHALGLGEARVDSYLNQPLDVRMRLLEATEDNLDSLTVSIASPADYERLGLSSAALALNIDVTIDRSQSPAVVRVTSSRPAADPVVQLLVDARWSSGRLLREYTLFLDPPTVAVAPPPQQAQRAAEPADDAEAGAERQRAAPPARSAEPPPREAPPARQETAPEPGPRADRPQAVQAIAGGHYGPVVSGDTLWSIARQSRPTGDVSMNQMMIAILELNPRAFADGNINRLLRGAELDLPTAEQARRINEAEATAAVAAQNRAFSRRRFGDPPVVADAARTESPTEDASERTARTGRPEDSPAQSAADPEHRLALVPPTDEEGGAGASGEDAEQLRRQLARAEEELFSARQQAEELQASLDELEAAVRDNPGALAIRDAELAGLEQTLREARTVMRPDANPEARAEVSRRLDQYLERIEQAPVVNDAAGGEPGDEVDSATAGPDAGQAAQAEAGEPGSGDADAAAPADSQQQRTVTQVDSGGTFDRFFDRPVLVLAVALVVLVAVLGGLWFVLRRRREQVRTQRPLRRASEIKPEPRVDTPEDRARARVAANPGDLATHLALLQTLASSGREAEFGDALEEMFDRVESGNEAEWREALELAGQVVPGHGLVKGSSDWVAESEALSDEELEPSSELDDEARVDDLMSRLDADLDEDEDEDQDWLGGDSGAESPAPEEHPIREHEPEEHREPPFSGPEAADDESDELLDFDALSDQEAGDGDETVPARSDEASGQEQPELSPSGRKDARSESGDSGGAGEQAGDEPGLDWVSESESSSTASGEDADEAEDDIFSPGDDDVEVKLDLARAYLSWHSNDSARTLLEEVAREGNEDQRAEARKLLDEMGDDSGD